MNRTLTFALQTVRVRERRVHLLKSTDPASESMSAFFAPHRPRVGGSMTESYTAAGQVLRSSEKACLRSPASRDRNTRRFDSASVSARVEKSCWLGRSQPGVSLAFNHLPTDAGSVVKYLTFRILGPCSSHFLWVLLSHHSLSDSSSASRLFSMNTGAPVR